MYKPDEDYGERLAGELRRVAKGTQVAVRLFILSGVLFIASCLLVLSACIKYLFFS
jgi:hypothetical protein